MNQVVHNAGRFRRGLGCCGLRRVGMGDGEDTSYLMDSGSSYDGGYYFDFYDAGAGVYWDEYGNPWQVGGGDYGSIGTGTPDFTADGYDEYGNPVLRINTDEYGNAAGDVNLGLLGKTWDWIETTAGAPVQLPAITYNAGYILTVPSLTLASDPNAPAVLKVPGNWDKIKAALAKIAKNVSMSAGSGSGAAAGGRPQVLQANAQGQCPAGYAKNAAGQCALVSAKPAATGNLFSNPLYLFLAAIGLILLVKR